jgi:hypothetical protein
MRLLHGGFYGAPPAFVVVAVASVFAFAHASAQALAKSKRKRNNENTCNPNRWMSATAGQLSGH